MKRLHAHQLVRTPGTIGCSGCDLQVTRPNDMPDYRRAAMRCWT